VLGPELRGRYEAYLPVAEFLADLCRLGERVLPHPAWVPAVLRRGRSGCLPAAGAPASLPDLWADLPEALAGRVAFPPEDLEALLCALADPPRFGTDADRYPAQQRWLAGAFTEQRGKPVAVLDLACGVGLGTFATAALARHCGVGPARVLGITLEPLEAWMAEHRCLPHDPPRERRLRQVAGPAAQVAFLAADVRHLPLTGPFAGVLCNGLMGGPWLHREGDMTTVLDESARVLTPDGWMVVANRFHEGCRAAVEAFMRHARERGWWVSGDWHDLVLRRGPGDRPSRAVQG